MREALRAAHLSLSGVQRSGLCHIFQSLNAAQHRSGSAMSAQTDENRTVIQSTTGPAESDPAAVYVGDRYAMWTCFSTNLSVFRSQSGALKGILRARARIPRRRGKRAF